MWKDIDFVKNTFCMTNQNVKSVPSRTLPSIKVLIQFLTKNRAIFL